jgi:hypothetical protein
MWNLSHGVLKFALNASIDTLPTFTNLKRWGKRASVNCHLCGNTVKQTLSMFLFIVTSRMDPGRMTWRHKSVLKHIASCLKSDLESMSTVEVYCNLEGLQAPGGGSISAEIMAQAQRPDLVILDRLDHGRHIISLVELMCPWDTDTDNAMDCKISKYAGLKIALSNEGWDSGTVVCIRSRLEHGDIFPRW